MEGQTREEEQRTNYRRQIIFYSTDLGSSTRVVEEFGEDLILNLQILPSSVMVKTLEITIYSKILDFDGDAFGLISLPDRVNSLTGPFFKDDLGRLFCSVKKEGSREKRLIHSDSAGMKFSLTNLTLPDQQPSEIIFKKNEILKGTIWSNILLEAKTNFTKEKFESNHAGWWSRMMAYVKQLLFYEQVTIVSIKLRRVTKNSFNDGETWSNLRVINPSNTFASGLECDINDVENCSLHKCGYRRISTKDEPTIGIIMTQG